MNFDSVIVICLESEYYCLKKVGQLLLSLTAKIDFSGTWLRFFTLQTINAYEFI